MNPKQFKITTRTAPRQMGFRHHAAEQQFGTSKCCNGSPSTESANRPQRPLTPPIASRTATGRNSVLGTNPQLASVSREQRLALIHSGKLFLASCARIKPSIILVRFKFPMRLSQGDNMKKALMVIAAIATLIAIGAPAGAADMAVKTPAVVPVFNWTGFYVGANVGGAWSHDNATLLFPDPPLSVLDPVIVNTGRAAAIGGFQEGFNWQFAPTWIWGLEADWSFTNASRTLSQGLTVRGMPVFASGSSLGTKLDWVGSARNRLGFLITPRLMLYGTGGVAWGRIDYTGAASLNDPVGFVYNANTAFTRTAVGWTAGAGLEWMITEHWLLRGEYLFYDLSSAQNMSVTSNLAFHGLCILGSPGCPPPPTATTSFSWANMTVNEVRAALSYKF